MSQNVLLGKPFGQQDIVWFSLHVLRFPFPDDALLQAGEDINYGINFGLNFILL
jgi:hypothetical protein